MNGPLVIEMARAFAERPDVQAASNPEKRAARMIELAWCRPASEREIALAVEFVEADQALAGATGSLNSWESLAQTLLLSNEFTHVE
jgi:hypothetical protein